MLLINVVRNSNYMTDETLITSNIVGMASNGIAEVNAKAKTNLPFFTDDNYQNKDYWAIPDTWVLRLMEPYLSFSIMANDGDSEVRDFHYNRFLSAIEDFIKNGLGDIVTIYPEGEPGAGEPTGFEGKSKRIVPIDVSARTVNYFGGW